jgi:hypothetical protein
MNIEGLAAIVTPSPELYEASMSAAREKHDERRAARHARVKHDVRRPLRNDNRIVMLSDLL